MSVCAYTHTCTNTDMHTEVYKYMNTDISKLGDVAPGYSCREAAQMDTWPKLCLHKLKHVWFWETQRRQEGRQRHSAGQVDSSWTLSESILSPLLGSVDIPTQVTLTSREDAVCARAPSCHS